ncbi:unnamed protein product [Strongylus vulgaris]|uniref:Fungal lipase-type domain-containing protein n=1 Tax=Strongylus vulgaris TaxID=40348 RepID=A0A3P7JNV2_STRVU|nr:unnamed protein product [Strongylus vulgaris]
MPRQFPAKFDDVYIARYFYDEFIPLWNNSGMSANVRELIKRHSDYNIWVCFFFITGHSLGGSLASLAALDIVHSGMGNNSTKDRIHLVTFGQPVTGDHNFADFLNKQVNYSYRIVHYSDPVVYFPIIGYEHQEAMVYYDKVMDTKYIICTGANILCFLFLCMLLLPFQAPKEGNVAILRAFGFGSFPKAGTIITILAKMSLNLANLVAIQQCYRVDFSFRLSIEHPCCRTFSFVYFWIFFWYNDKDSATFY